MKRNRSLSLLCLCAVILLNAHGRALAAEETEAEKLRKALDQVRDLELADQPLDTAVNQLREQTGLNILIDTTAVSPMQAPAQISGFPIPAWAGGSYFHLQVGGRFHGVPLRTALTKLLRRHNLTHVVIGDTVFITMTDQASERQLGQSVSVNIEGVALRDALTKLARETATNLVLDPRVANKGQAALTLRLEDVPLKTVVDLLADEAGLRAVRLHNVLYVTSEDRAEKLRKELQPEKPPVPGWRVYPDGHGGFRLTPPEGTPNTGGGSSGGGGIAGLGGMGGIGGLGGMGGIAGIGGGALGFQGGMPRGVSSPVPLTPPIRKNQPAPAAKPAKEAPPESAKKQEDTVARKLKEKLALHVNYPGIDDPKATLEEVLENVEKRYDIPFAIDKKAFERVGLKEVGRLEIIQSKVIPEMKDVPLSTVLESVLQRIPAPGGAKYNVLEERVIITTNRAEKKKQEAQNKPGAKKKSP